MQTCELTEIIITCASIIYAPCLWEVIYSKQTMMKAITDLQYASAHVNFVTSTGLGPGSLWAKLKQKLLEVVIGGFKMKIKS